MSTQKKIRRAFFSPSLSLPRADGAIPSACAWNVVVQHDLIDGSNGSNMSLPFSSPYRYCYCVAARVVVVVVLAASFFQRPKLKVLSNLVVSPYSESCPPCSLERGPAYPMAASSCALHHYVATRTSGVTLFANQVGQSISSATPFYRSSASSSSS